VGSDGQNAGDVVSKRPALATGGFERQLKCRLGGRASGRGEDDDWPNAC
jgi:hypothetical protein